jgi:hypothetical protein
MVVSPPTSSTNTGEDTISILINAVGFSCGGQICPGGQYAFANRSALPLCASGGQYLHRKLHRDVTHQLINTVSGELLVNMFICVYI